MKRLFLAPFQFALIAATLSFAAQAASPKLAPAPYKPLSVGTVLDYGLWKCTVTSSSGMQTVCSGGGGNEVSFLGKFVPAGKLPANGYGTKLTGVWCGSEGSASLNNFRSSFERFEYVEIDETARKAIAGLWPLEVGKEISFRKNFRPTDGKATARIRVKSTKTVTIAGVTRHIYVVTGETLSINCSEIESPGDRGFKEVWWYDPELAAVVRYDFDWIDSRDADDIFEYELVSARFPKPTAIAKASSPPIPRAASPALGNRAIDKTAPVIETPAALTTDTANVRIVGKVVDASKVIELTLNGRQIQLSGDGSFRIDRSVPVGTSAVTLVAVDEWSNRARKKITLTRHWMQLPPQMVAVPQALGRPVKKPDLFDGIHFGNYHALVIGNNKYKGFRDLKTAVADARAVGRLLKENYAFNVEILINTTRSGVIGALARMRAKLGANDSLLVYYAGHGVVDEITEQGYWLPVDAERDNPANWVSTFDITTMLRAMRAKHVMVVADSCYSGTLVRAATAKLKTARDQRTWISRMVNRRSRTALVSGGLEPVLNSGGAGHSVFAKAFLDILRENDGVMEGQALFDALKRPVVLNSD